MRIRTLLAGAVLALLTIFATPGVAGAAGESVGGCIVGAVHDAEKLDLSEEEIEEKAANSVEKCIQAPNPILPEVAEILWGGLAFLILLGALSKWALPAMKDSMNARSEKIRSELEVAERAKMEAESMSAARSDETAAAKAEASKIIEEARQQADVMKADLKTRAEAEVEEMKQKAAGEVEASKAQAMADVQGDVASMAIGAAETVVEKNLDRDTQLQLIENYINQVGTK